MEGEGKRKEQPKKEVEGQGAMATKDRVKGRDDEDRQRQAKVNTVKMSIPSPVNNAVGNTETGGGDLKKEGEGEGLNLEGGNNSLSPSAPPDMGSEQEDADGAATKTDECGSQVKEEFSMYKVPEEIWEQILNEVKAGKDKAMCCQASTYFDMVLTKSKPIWQFKMVYSDVSKYLSRTDIYNCRLVCKQWKEDIIDASVQCQVYYADGEYRNTFSSSADIDRCLQKFDGHSGNPFVDRIVHLNCHFHRVNQEQQFLLKIFELVEKFGKHINYLRIRDLEPFFHPQLFYASLSRILMNTPSLRALIIDVLNVDADNDDGEAEILIIDDDYIRELNDAIESGPLPYLPSLETLWLRPLVQFPASLHEAILLPYITGEKPQLKRLGIPMDCWQDEYAQGLSSLEEAYLMKITCNDDLGKLLLVNNAPIVDMRLIFESLAKISFSMLIKVVCKFPVERLDLMLHDGAEFVDDDGQAADLIANMKSEKLWYLHISHELKFSYNFLKIFPSLKSLRVGLWKPLRSYLGWRKESKQDVQLYRMMEDSQLYESNIWRLFPDLEALEIYHHHYQLDQLMPQYQFVGTRAAYDGYCSQKVPYFPIVFAPLSQTIVAFIAISSFVILQRKFKIF